MFAYWKDPGDMTEFTLSRPWTNPKKGKPAGVFPLVIFNSTPVAEVALEATSKDTIMASFSVVVIWIWPAGLVFLVTKPRLFEFWALFTRKRPIQLHL